MNDPMGREAARHSGGSLCGPCVSATREDRQRWQADIDARDGFAALVRSGSIPMGTTCDDGHGPKTPDSQPEWKPA